MYKIGIQNHPQIIPVFVEEWLEDNSINLPSLLTQSYVLAVVLSPIVVAETLAQLQYQRIGEEEKDEGFSLNEPLNHGQFQNIRSIYESPYDGWGSLLKGIFYRLQYYQDTSQKVFII